MNTGLLVAGVAAALAAVALAWPAWRSSQNRATRMENEERYLAWRGRADRVAASPGPSAGERRRIVLGVGLGVVAAACLVIGLGGG